VQPDLFTGLPPNHLHFGISGFEHFGFEIELLRTGQLKITTGFRDGEPSFITPTPEQWEKFWHEVDAIGVWTWKSSYSSMVLDGSWWEIDIAHGTRRLQSEGNNAWPESEDPAGPLTYPAAGQFERFLRAITFLTGEPLPDPLGAGEFKCPECGSTEPYMEALVEPAEGDKSAWGMVLHRISCPKCHYYIPAHVAHRWDNSSYEQAVADWRADYRSDAPRDTEEN
jgi:hypothetical protein